MSGHTNDQSSDIHIKLFAPSQQLETKTWQYLLSKILKAYFQTLKIPTMFDVRETKIKTLKIHVGWGTRTTNSSTREAETQVMSQVQSYPGYITSTRAARDTWEEGRRGKG